MSTPRRNEHGFVTVIALSMMTITLLLAFAMLAIVDIQGSAARGEESDNIAYNTAEGVGRGAVAALGSGALWPVAAAQTPSGSDAQRCGANAYGGAGDGSAFGTALRTMVAQTYGTTAGSWKVNVCAVASAAEHWSDEYLTTRVAHADPADAATRDLLWVRAQTTLRGAPRAVTVKVRTTRYAAALPSSYAVVTGAFGVSDLVTTTGALLSKSGLLGGVVTKLLNPGGAELYEDAAAKLGVRCGLLHVAHGQLCLTGTLASAAGAVDLLGLSPLNTILGTGRFEQIGTYQVASDEQLAAWKAEAQASGTYHAAVGAGAQCFASATAAQVVWVEQVGDGSEQCILSGGKTAKVLVVAQGRVRVQGTGTVSQPPVPTFTGLLYGLNRRADGTVDRTSNPPRDVVTITDAGTVVGAVFVDGNGNTVTRMPPVNANTLCNGLLGSLVCALHLGDLVNFLLGAVGLNSLIGGVTSQLTDYTAVKRDTGVIANAAPTLTAGSTAVVGSFRQIPPN